MLDGLGSRKRAEEIEEKADGNLGEFTPIGWLTFHRKLMQSVFCFGGYSSGAGGNLFAKQLQLLTQGEFFNENSFCASGFVMSVPYCLDKGS